MTTLAKSAINRINCCDACATAKKKNKKKKPEYYTCRNFRLLLGIARGRGNTERLGVRIRLCRIGNDSCAVATSDGKQRKEKKEITTAAESL